jgi:hypothetical protein
MAIGGAPSYMSLESGTHKSARNTNKKRRVMEIFLEFTLYLTIFMV